MELNKQHLPLYHSASNGLAERAVQIFENGMKKMTEGSLPQ